MPSTPSQKERSVRFRKWALGFLVIAAVVRFGPVSFSTAMFTNSSQNSAQVGSAADWTPPTVALDYPGDAIRGIVTISATASDAETGIKNVAIAWAPTGTTSFTTLCTDTSSPYSCSFTTTSISDQDIDIRAIATDNSNYTSTDLLEGITIDNTTPTVSLNAIASPMSGVVTITATATDAGSGIANVVIQRSLSGLNSWVPLCTATTSPYSCRFDTTTVSDGTYDFRAIATDVAGNPKTSSTVNNRIISNVLSSVSVDDPGAYIRGTVTITANANASTGVANVKIQRAPFGSTTWTDLCTDTTSPYSCSFVTTSVADGQYQFRAILTDNLTVTTTSATVGPVQVDNTPVRGYDVQATNVTTVGKIAANDTIAVTYTKAMNLTTIMSGWTGTSTAVVVRIRDGAVLGLTNVDDTLDVFTTSALTTPVNLGSVNLKGNFAKGNKTITMNATMVATTVTVNGASATKVTLTIGSAISQGGSLRTASSTPVNMLWTPSATAKDTNAIATSTAAVTELGTADRDF
jgi:hypothetical protein